MAAASASLILVIFMICHLPVAIGHRDDCTPGVIYTDGCSPRWLSYGYKTKFTPSCTSHDICYGCGAAYGIVRSECDRLFHDNMRSQCYSEYSDDLDSCLSWAKTIHGAVRAFGGSHYEKSAESYCHESWVMKCIL